MKRILFALLFIPLLAWGQSSAVQINSAGKIVVPASGNLTSPGLITAQTVTSNGTLTAGNVTSAGTITGATVTSNGTLTAGNLSTSGVLTLPTGNATAAASGNATGLTSGTLPDARFSGNYTSDVRMTNLTVSWKPSFANAILYTDCFSTGITGIEMREATVPVSSYIYVASQGTLMDYTGDLVFRNGYGGTSNGLLLPDAGGAKIGGTSASTILKIHSTSASIDFANTTAQTTNSGNTITVTGVATTNTPSVEIGLSAALPTGCSVHGRVTGSNTVTLYFVNASASAQDPGAITIRATVTGF